jgi:hypothetical protein
LAGGNGPAMPRAYDNDFERESADPKTAEPFRVGLTEAIGALSALYVICIASFNAGYFERLKGRFIQLFSFADLIGSNILQYIFVVFSFTAYLQFT